ncbi:MAG: MCP four helix bundle domain-containing protein [Anaerolineae bacterium]|nr:MCP four helix bundle domain-containing protein [Anaerolineae bacterium]
MSLRIKLASLFILVALSVLVIGLVNIQLMRGTTQEYSELINQNVPVFIALGHIQSSTTKIREEALTVLLLINEAQSSRMT